MSEEDLSTPQPDSPIILHLESNSEGLNISTGKKGETGIAPLSDSPIVKVGTVKIQPIFLSIASMVKILFK